MNILELTNQITQCSKCELSNNCTVGPIGAFIVGSAPLDILFVNGALMSSYNDYTCLPLSSIQKTWLTNQMNLLKISNWGITASVKCPTESSKNATKIVHKKQCLNNLISEISVYKPKFIIGLGQDLTNKIYFNVTTITLASLNYYIQSSKNEQVFIQTIKDLYDQF